MKNRRITSIIFVILATTTFWLIINKGNSTIKKELRDFAIADTSSVSHMRLSDNNGHVIDAVKQKSGRWKVNEKFEASPERINIILKTMKLMAVRNPVGNAMKDNIIKSMASSGIKVEMYSGEELIKLFYVGSQTADMTGTFMLLADPETKLNSTAPFEMCIPGFDGFLTTRFAVNESDWRERVVFRISPPEINSIRIEFPQLPNDGYEIFVDKNASAFKLKTLVPDKSVNAFDTASIRQYLIYYQDIQYEMIEKFPRSFIDSIVATKPLCIMTVTNKENKSSSIKIFYKPAKEGSVDREGKPLLYDEDRIFALINDGKDFVTIQYFVFGKLLQPIGYFLPKSIVKKFT